MFVVILDCEKYFEISLCRYVYDHYTCLIPGTCFIAIVIKLKDKYNFVQPLCSYIIILYEITSIKVEYFQGPMDL
jgi:hypothetical protein